MKRLPIAAALAACALLPGCLGPNRAFRSVHSWNTRATDNKWANTLIHAGFWIVPVYPLTLFGDIVLFNTIQFFGGENPLEEPEAPRDQG